MQAEAINERQLSSAAQAVLSAVSELVSDPKKRVYAAMDGSQFNDLPRLLKQIDVSHRPLYRQAGGDYSVILGGPWLVNPYQSAVPHQSAKQFSDEDGSDVSDEALAQRSAALSEQMVASLNAGDPTGGGMLPINAEDPSLAIARLRKLVQLSDGKPALVFWCGDEQLSAERLYRHLRGLNRILVPKVWRDSAASIEGPRVSNEVEFTAAGDGVPSPNEESASDEMAIFRHSDANVMMQTIPALNEMQVARLFALASIIIFAPDEAWGGGVKRARRGGDIVPPQGPLTLDRDAMAAMSASRLEMSRKKVMSYLREVDPQNNNISDKKLSEMVVKYEIIGDSLGLKSERAHMKWAYLMSITSGLVNNREVGRYFENNKKHPDEAIDDILDELDEVAGGEWDALAGSN